MRNVVQQNVHIIKVSVNIGAIVTDQATDNPSTLSPNDLRFIKTTKGAVSAIENIFDSIIAYEIKRLDDYKEFGLKRPTRNETKKEEFTRLIGE